MTTIRLMPPPSPAAGVNPITVNGRYYTCAQGATIDVPDFDAEKLVANGWINVAQHGANTTAARPSNPTKGMTFLDTSLGYVIRYDGSAWRNPATGAAV